MSRTLRPIMLALAALAAASCGEPAPEGTFDKVDPARVEDYIRSDSHRRLVLEVDYVSGHAPSPESIAQLVDGLDGLVDKPGGVEVVLDEALAAGGDDDVWTLSRIDAVERDTFDLDVDAETIKMHVLFLDGHYERDTADTQILGLSWANRNVVVFKERLDETCANDSGETLRRRGLVEKACQQTELAIWTHEVGHALGLVANGLPMVDDHQDPAHPHHDHNDACVMHWAYDRAQAFDEVRKRVVDDEDAPPLGFDDACRADIAAMRER
ncbi:hypothetical protein [Persicimonas caeni]|uniref:hypothetical protein n=1 Tax=Persicimonas caeni TaxID=2292766 RepID=UPI00143D876A|nr:hypothetical protein [Persicimonas caeni]